MTGYAESALAQSLHWLSQAQATIAHNLANVSTVGYKSRQPFAVARGDDATRFSRLLDGVAASDIRFAEAVDWSAGHARPTGERFHLAIDGPQFFAVRDAAGNVAFTRRGEMIVDASGHLALSSGERLLGANGAPLHIGRATAFDVAPNGGVTSDGPDGILEHGRVGLFTLDRTALAPLGAGLWRLPGGASLPPSDGTASVRQGYLEQSNTEALDELVAMIAVQRGFQATTRALSTFGRVQDTFVSSFDR